MAEKQWFSELKIPITTSQQIELLRNLDLLDKKINAKLMEWDPVGVSTFEGLEHNLWVEYLRYIPQLREALEKGKPIKPILDWIEGESIGSYYTSETTRIQIAKELEELFLKNI